MKSIARLKILLLALWFGLTTSVAQAPLDIRIAFVIGNGAYSNAPQLDNTKRDADAISQSLRSLGFKVVELRDATKAQMIEALDNVRKGLQGHQGLGMLYYAGHGLQVDWRNYLLPVDARLTKVSDLPLQAMDVGAVVETFKAAGTRMNILVLDACRDNPFAGLEVPNKGLAPMDAPTGTLFAYATQPGNVAEDRDPSSNNGPYAQSLKMELRRPFAKVEDVFKRVRYQVRQKTEGRQIPWESTSLEDDFIFNDGTREAISAEDLDRLALASKQREQELIQKANQVRERERELAADLEKQRLSILAAAQRAEQRRQEEAAKVAAAEKMAAVASQKEQQRLAAEAQRLEAVNAARETQIRDRERQPAFEQAKEQAQRQQIELELAKARETEKIRQLYAEQLTAEKRLHEKLKRLPKERQQELVFVEEKAEWDIIRDSKKSSDVYAYLAKYPNGSVSELAQAKLEQLDKPKIQPVPDSTGQVQQFEAKRFKLGDTYQFVVRDILTKLEIERPVLSVVKIDSDVVEFNQGYKVTQTGAIIRTIAGATLDPYQQWIPSGEYQVGKKWYTRSIMTLKDGRTMWVGLNGKVTAREMITVPAGNFDTYRMEMEQVAEDGTRLKITYWGQPDWGVAVKQIREIRDSRGQLSGQIYEMVSRKRGV